MCLTQYAAAPSAVSAIAKTQNLSLVYNRSTNATYLGTTKTLGIFANSGDNHVLIDDDDDRPAPLTIASAIEVFQPRETALEVRTLYFHNP